MNRARRPVLFFVSLLFTFAGALALRAQTTSVPTVTTAIPAQTFASVTGSTTVDLRNYFNVPGITGTVVQFVTDLGRFNVQTLPADAPISVTNFLSYITDRAYDGTIIHRSAALNAAGNGIIQGGGYTYSLNPSPAAIAKKPAIALEYKLANVRGTLAMARTSEINSATSEWFFNIDDNTTVLGPANGGGYAVFGRVLGSGMSVVDAIYALPTFNVGSPFTNLPLRNVATGQTAVALANLVQVAAVAVVPVYPGTSGASVLTFSVTSSDASVATGTISGSTLTVTPVAGGTATLTVRATDTNSNVATSAVTVSVSAAPVPPVFATHPAAQTVASGSTVVFNAAASGSPTYQWQRNGSPIDGATSATLVISGASAAQAGTYTVVATNIAGSQTSSPAVLTVNNASAAEAGRLVNLSILTTAGTGAKILTVGAVVGPLGSSESLPLVVRAVGPSLADFFGLGGVLADPVLTVFAQGSDAAVATNDNWGVPVAPATATAAALSAAFSSVGAFPLTAGSLDSAYAALTPGLRTGGYTVQVAGKGTASGTVIAEIYDAAGAARTATTPRLINLSTRAVIDTGGELRVGFVLRGLSARTVLVRAVGPSLGALGVEGVMADPKLELFDNDNGGKKIGENDNWGGDAQLAAVSTSAGAFALAGATTKDAVMLVTLAPGAYSARLSAATGTGGTAIVEVYEVR